MAYQRKTFDCEACGKRTPNALAIRISGSNYCSTCADALDVMVCEECDCLLHPEDVRTSGDKQLCSDCLEATYKHCCMCDIVLEPDYMGNTEYMMDGDHYCQNCYEQTFSTCIECGELVYVDDVRDNPCHEPLCMDCFEELCVVCSDCGDTIWLDDSRSYGGADFCEDCYHENCDCEDQGWVPQRFNPDSNAYRRIGSRRQFGLELEYNGATNANQSKDALRHFGCKDEHCGIEFYSSILQGDRGLSTVEDLAHYATDNNWRLNRSCGYHLHLDMRNESLEKLHVLAYAYLKTYHVWRRFVNVWRRNSCTFCHATHERPDEIRALDNDEFRRWMDRSDRYNYVNWNAHSVHGSVEIRLHHATRDATAIVNWIKVHARFVDWALEQDFDSVDAKFSGYDVAQDFDALAEIWGSPGLRSYYRARANACEAAIPVQQRVPA